MKKIVSVLIIAVSISIAIPVQAQIQFGVKGGVNLVGAPDVDNTDVESTTGFFIGPIVDFSIPIVGIGLDASLLYSQKGNEFNGKTVLQQGIEIPINLKYSLGLGDMASIFAAVGPSGFINFNSDPKSFSVAGIESVDYKAYEISINVGVGVKLLGNLQVGLNYNMPVTNSAIIETIVNPVLPLPSSSSIKAKTWQISLAYFF